MGEERRGCYLLFNIRIRFSFCLQFAQSCYFFLIIIVLEIHINQNSILILFQRSLGLFAQAHINEKFEYFLNGNIGYLDYKTRKTMY